MFKVKKISVDKDKARAPTKMLMRAGEGGGGDKSYMGDSQEKYRFTQSST